MSYLEDRVYTELGISPEQQKIKLFVEVQEGVETEIEQDIFSIDADDNIKILYYTLDRRPIIIQHPDADLERNNINNNRTSWFYQTRLKEVPEDGGKYRGVKGGGTHPFLPPALVAKYERREKIPTLVLTEGAFKAMKASLYDIDIVGLSSIQHYRNNKTKVMYDDVRSLIIECQVENVVMLYDGDCLNFSAKDLAEGKDLMRRPKNFFFSMQNIFELLKGFEVSVYFAHILSESVKGNPKGMDDLLCALIGEESLIKNELTELPRPGYYIYRQKLSPQKGFSLLWKYFNLTNVNTFYSYWQTNIKDAIFVFNGTKYKADAEGKIELISPKELEDYMRVGNVFYEKVMKPTPIPNYYEEVLLVRKREVIKDDFDIKDIFKKIRKYKDFVNIPEHVSYQQVIDNCYNIYRKLEYSPQEGACDNILRFVRHIFGEQYELGLDYLQLLYIHPRQLLPVLCLVSSERETGKTTFLNLLTFIFGGNAVVVGNTEMDSEFNSIISNKLIVGVDETSLNKAESTERIKKLSTAMKNIEQKKNVDHSETWNFTKYILNSNKEDSFILIDKDETRFWVRHVPKIEKKQPDLLFVMQEEIPCFLNYLCNRKMHTEQRSRSWFNPTLLKTEALSRLQAQNQPKAEKEIRLMCRDLFLDFTVGNTPGLTDDTTYYMTIENLRERCQLNRFETDYLRRILRDNIGLKTVNEAGISTSPVRWSLPKWVRKVSGESEAVLERFGPSRPFVFHEKDFLTPEEIEAKHAGAHGEEGEAQVSENQLPF